jgi:hypothetical protein
METPNGRERQLAPVERQASVPAPRRAGTFVAVLRTAAQPLPLERPQVDPDLTSLSATERSAEVLRYTSSRLEYWLSPQGELRAWFKLNLLLGLFLAVPVVLVAPVITLLLSTVATWSQYLLAAAVNTLLALLAFIGIAAILTGAFFLVRFLRGR